MPQLTRRRALKLLLEVHARLADQADLVPPVHLPADIWQTCSTLATKLNRAVLSRRPLAAQRLHRRLTHSLASLRDRLARLPVNSSRDTSRISEPVDIYRDLLALESEFTVVAVENRRRLLSVTTAPVRLEGIDFGRFSIELELRALPGDECYRVVALEPVLAASECDLHHPHVQGEVLCEGYARPHIERALAEGRLLDFFLLVSQTLHTYNASSAYASLEEWQGERCVDCGGSVPDEQVVCCGDCARCVCEGCSSACRTCDTDYCSGCCGKIHACSDCRRELCPDCKYRCRGCQKWLCHDCLEPSETCQECHGNETQEPETKPAATPAKEEASPIGS